MTTPLIVKTVPDMKARAAKALARPKITESPVNAASCDRYASRPRIVAIASRPSPKASCRSAITPIIGPALITGPGGAG